MVVLDHAPQRAEDRPEASHVGQAAIADHEITAGLVTVPHLIGHHVVRPDFLRHRQVAVEDDPVAAVLDPGLGHHGLGEIEALARVEEHHPVAGCEIEPFFVEAEDPRVAVHVGGEDLGRAGVEGDAVVPDTVHHQPLDPGADGVAPGVDAVGIAAEPTACLDQFPAVQNGQFIVEISDVMQAPRRGVSGEAVIGHALRIAADADVGAGLGESDEAVADFEILGVVFIRNRQLPQPVAGLDLGLALEVEEARDTSLHASRDGGVQQEAGPIALSELRRVEFREARLDAHGDLSGRGIRGGDDALREGQFPVPVQSGVEESDIPAARRAYEAESPALDGERRSTKVHDDIRDIL